MYSCKEGIDNPIVGSFFFSGARDPYPSYGRSATGRLYGTFDTETLKKNVGLLDRIVLVAAPVVLPEKAKVDLFQRFNALKDKDPAAIVASLRRFRCDQGEQLI
jgi:hypothetical protein